MSSIFGIPDNLVQFLLLIVEGIAALALVLMLIIGEDFVGHILTKPKLTLGFFGAKDLDLKWVNFKGQMEEMRFRFLYINVNNLGNQDAVNPCDEVYYSDNELKRAAGTLSFLKGNLKLPEDVVSGIGDNLARDVIKNSISTTDRIWRKRAVAFVIGFTFAGSDKFYFATSETALPDSVPLGPNTKKYLGFVAYAERGKQRTINLNSELMLDSWDTVNVRYSLSEKEQSDLKDLGIDFPRSMKTL